LKVEQAYLPYDVIRAAAKVNLRYGLSVGTFHFKEKGNHLLYQYIIFPIIPSLLCCEDERFLYAVIQKPSPPQLTL